MCLKVCFDLIEIVDGMKIYEAFKGGDLECDLCKGFDVLYIAWKMLMSGYGIMLP